MTTPASPPTPVEDEPSSYWNIVPPLASARRVLFSLKPVSEIEKKSHRLVWRYGALIFLMGLAMLLLMAGEQAPFNNPITALWTMTFEQFVQPVQKWLVLIPCGLILAAAALLVHSASWVGGWRLATAKPSKRQQALELAYYGALGAVAVSLATMLAIYAAGWALHLIKIRIFIFGWMTAAPVITIPLTTAWLWRVFGREHFGTKKRFLVALFISTAAIITSTAGGMFLMDYVDDVRNEQGRAVNGARLIPTAAVVQACIPAGPDIVCAVTLFPQQWQDYELIGAWEQGAVDSKGEKAVRARWQPSHSADQVFALVSLEGRKDVTVEIRIAAAAMCSTAGTALSEADVFFFVRGRVRGEQRNAGQEMRIRIDNAAPKLSHLMQESCRTHQMTR